MPRKALRALDGLNTNTATPEPEDAVVARNLVYSRQGECKTRLGTRRVWDTRTANAPTLNLYEWRNNSGTIFRMTKCNGALETFSLTAATAKTSLETSMSTSGPADMRAMDGLLYVADQANENKISTGASGAANTQKLRAAAPTSASSPAGNGSGSGLAAGTYRTAYSFFNPTLNDETPPRAYESVTITAGQNIRHTTPADPGNGYTTLRWYRTLVNEVGPFYRVLSSTTFASTADMTVSDTDIADNPSTYPLSTLHDPNGAITAVVPPACYFVEANKSVLWLASSAANPLRVFASKIGEPSNFSTTATVSGPAYHHDLLEGQGQRCMGMNDLNGALVCFKDYSIHVKNGGFNSDSWEWYVPVDGVGCIARWSRAVAPGLGVFFASANGVYLFDGTRALNLSDKPNGKGIGRDYRALDLSQTEEWTGIWSEEIRAYLLAVTPSGETTPTRVYAYFYDTGKWSTFEFGMGLTGITAMGIITNSDSEPTVYLGTADGYALEMNRSAQADGPISGTVTGTSTAATSTTLTDSTAAFYATNDDLTGMVLTVRHSASSYESRVIASNTGTAITVASAWSVTPVDGSRYFVGAIRTTLALGGFDAGDAGEKQWHGINISWSKQSHVTPIRLGFTLDDSSVPSYGGDEETAGDVRAAVGVNDFGVECGLYLDVIGTDAPVELKQVEYDWSWCGTRSPAA